MSEPEQEIVDERPQVFVHCETASDDPVRVFYEIPDRIAELVAMGVDGICTNVPDLARRVIETS